MSSFLLDLRSRTPIFSKEKARFPVTKDIGLNFLVLLSVTNLSEHFIRVQNMFVFTSTVEVTRSFV